MCNSIGSQIGNYTDIQIEPTQLRQFLEMDIENMYPHPVVCCICCGFAENMDSILTLLIDDGVIDRSNRATLLNPSLNFVGLCAQDLGETALRCTVYLFTDLVESKAGDHVPQTVTDHQPVLE